jgi:hypothetical protein
MKVKVINVIPQWFPNFDLVQLSCGHCTSLDHDEPNTGLLGADTVCPVSHPRDQEHKAA